MYKRLIYLIRLYITLLLIFMTQKVVFMLVGMGHADGAPFGQCVAALWHGLRLDSVTACYIIVIPLLLVVVSCLAPFKKFRKWHRPYFAVVAILMAMAFVADTVMYFFWGAKIDANELMYAAKPKEMLASIEWWTVIVGAVLLAAVVWHYVRRMMHTVPGKLFAVENKWHTLIFIPIAALVFIGMRGGLSKSTANPSYAYFSKYAFCNHAALNPLFNMIHSMFKVKDLEHEFVFMSDDEAQSIAMPVFAYDGSVKDTLLNTSRPDILLIVWEGGGWDMTMSDSISPNLMRYSREGVLFSNCMANNFRTDRGLVSILNGWQGLATTSLMKMSDKCRKLPALASSLKNEGYATRFVYGGDLGFTNMRMYLSETGFESVVGIESFPDSRGLSNWGAPDAYVLTTDQVAKQSPSFTTILTLSSHEPWDVPMHRLQDIRKNTFAYTDSCIGVLVDQLRQSPRWDSMLVIIIPDHGIPQSNSQSTSDPAVSHIPVVWTGGAVRQHREFSQLMSQSDLAATLLAQLNIDASDFVFSNNVLSFSYANRRPFALHAFKSGYNYITPTGSVRYECINDSVIPMDADVNADDDRFVHALVQYIYQRTSKL